MSRSSLRLIPPLLCITVGLGACADGTPTPVDPVFDETSQPLAPPDGAPPQEQVIPGQYIVVFNDDVADPPGLARALAVRHGFQVDRTYSHALKGFSLHLPPSARDAVLEALSRNPRVNFIEQDRMWFVGTKWDDIRAETGFAGVGSAAGSLALPGFASGVASVPDQSAFQPVTGRSASIVTPAFLAPPPNAPSGLSLSVASALEIHLTWTDNSSDETIFEVERCLGPGCVDFSTIGSTKADVVSYSDSGLLPETTYCYRVSAVSGRGSKATPSDPSDSACAATASDGGGGGEDPPPADDRPTDLTATAQSGNQVGLTWTDNSDESGFAIERCEGQGCGGFSEVAQVGRGVTSFLDSGLTEGATYCYRVRGFKTRGKKTEYTAYSTSACATTESPPEPATDPPTNLVATAVGTDAIDLSWEDNSDETAFLVERCQGAGCGDFVQVGELAADVVAFGDRGLTAGTEYCYRVRGDMGDGSYTAYSASACISTDDPPPPPPPGEGRFVSDSFQDAPGALLQNHTGETGAEWAQHPSSSTNAVFGSDGSEVHSTASATYVASGTPPGADYRSAATVHFYSTVSGYTRFAYVTGRMNQTATTMYMFGYRLAGANRWELRKLVNGVESLLAYSSESRPAYGAVAMIDLRMEGSSIRGFVDGIEILSVSDSDIVDAGWAGVRLHSGPSGNVLTLMDFEATTLDLAPGPPPAIDPPTNLVATAAGMNGIDLSWEDNSDETAFLVERCQGLGCSGFTQVAEVGAGIVAYSDTDLLAGTGYCYRVRGDMGDGSYTAYSSEACTSTDSPPSLDPPTNLAAFSLVNGDIRISWQDNSDETEFSVERCVGAGCAAFAELIRLGQDVSTWTDSGLTAGTDYCYRVQGVLGAEVTGYSNISCATAREYEPGICPDTGGHDDISNLWGIQAIGASENPSWLGTQNGGDCAIQGWLFSIDTGVDLDHPDLNVVEGIDFVNGSDPDDGHGHGSHTAGTAAAIDGNGGVVGVAPGAPIYGFKVCDAGGNCAMSAILSAVDEVTYRKVQNPAQPMVANMSLGGDPDAALEQAVRTSVNSGVVYAIAAGNGLLGACWLPADAAGFSPALVGDDEIAPDGGTLGNGARINGVLTTTSHTESFTDANCNYGNPVTVASPGVNIFSTIQNGGYGSKSGTSMASPHTAGAALLYLQGNPTATPAEVEAAVVNMLQAWTTSMTPNASGRLYVGGL